jgi:hypothetical protein
MRDTAALSPRWPSPKRSRSATSSGFPTPTPLPPSFPSVNPYANCPNSAADLSRNSAPGTGSTGHPCNANRERPKARRGLPREDAEHEYSSESPGPIGPCGEACRVVERRQARGVDCILAHHRAS